MQYEILQKKNVNKVRTSWLRLPDTWRNTGGGVGKFFLVLTIFSIWIFLRIDLNIVKNNMVLLHHFFGSGNGEPPRDIGFLVNTPGCHLPDLDPFDPSVRKFIKKPKPVDCAQDYGPELVSSDLNRLLVNSEALADYNVTDFRHFHCCYTAFWRQKMEERGLCDYPGHVDRKSEFAKDCIFFQNTTEVKDEFVKVECFYKNVSIYKDYHAFIPAQKVSQTLQKQKQLNKEEDHVNVLILGVDSVSRLNLHRNMPETAQLLNSLEAIELLGYNKVADNTFPNLIPVTTGQTVEELNNSCWPNKSCVFDNCNYIWDKFNNSGHVTGFMEETTSLGLFAYNKKGFYKPPTDFYIRVFDKESSNDIGSKIRFNTKLCIGPRKSLTHLLNYVDKFTTVFKSHRYFDFVWSVSLTHDNFNLAKEGDKEWKQFLQKMVDKGVLENTVLVFMSDHGMRWGAMRKTYQGYLEERLPFVFILIPKWFKRKFKSAVNNLKTNARRLTSPFDLHEFLNDLNQLESLKDDALRDRVKDLNPKKLPRGISLFVPVPKERTCEAAGISEHWCCCHQYRDIFTDNPLVTRSAQHLVEHINSLIRDYDQCAHLSVTNIISARSARSTSLTAANLTTSDLGITDFSVVFSTDPGHAMFEGHVRHDANTDEYRVVGTVSRINAYGSQSRCVQVAHLKLYCYCS